LRGLVAKSAAVITEQDPQIFRAIQPTTLLAKIVAEQEGKLDALERQVATRSGEGVSSATEFSGEREFFALALRTITRSPGPVTCLALPQLLSTLLPIWRKRLADGAETHLWTVGSISSDFPVAIAGAVPEQLVLDYFGDAAVILVEQAHVAMGVGRGDELTGVWSSQATLTGVARAALAAFTRST
jgi:sugar-specific transcriptional regulator TrmB